MTFKFNIINILNININILIYSCAYIGIIIMNHGLIFRSDFFVVVVVVVVVVVITTTITHYYCCYGLYDADTILL